MAPNTCSVCHSSKIKIDSLKTGKQLSVCQKCYFAQVFPLSDNQSYQKEIDQYYKETDPSESVARARIQIYQRFLECFNTEGRRLCDIGCGTGAFVHVATLAGWDAEGMEPNIDLAKKGEDQYNVKIHQKDVMNWEENGAPYDLITMWNVFDELPDPLKAVESIHQHLTSQGKLFLRIPNMSFHYTMGKIQKIFPFLFKVNPIYHRFNFTPRAIRTLLEKKGFKNIKIKNSKPTTGDPYTSKSYVALVKNIIYFFSQVLFIFTLGYKKMAPSIEITAEKKDKVRVLHIITRLDKGGSATNTLETMARLNKEVYDGMLLFGKTEDPKGEIKKFIEDHHIKSLCLPSLRRNPNIFYDFIAFIQLSRFIKGKEWDIVHTHSSKAGILGRWAAWIKGVPYIIHTPHGHVFYGYFNKMISLIFIWVEQITALVTRRIITLTEKGRQDHIQHKIASAEKFVPIYSGIAIDQYQMQREGPDGLRASLDIPQDAVLIGSVSRLDNIKGNQYLVEAFIALAQEYPQAYLLLVGDGEDKKKLQALSHEAGLTKRIIFAGFREDVPHILNIMDIFVLASLNEGMGRVILEAMASEVPVVATNVGGISELVKDQETGVLVQAQDAKALKSALIDVIQYPDKYASLAKQAKAMVTKKFSIEQMVLAIEDVYVNVSRSRK